MFATIKSHSLPLGFRSRKAGVMTLAVDQGVAGRRGWWLV